MSNGLVNVRFTPEGGHWRPGKGASGRSRTKVEAHIAFAAPKVFDDGRWRRARLLNSEFGCRKHAALSEITLLRCRKLPDRIPAKFHASRNFKRPTLFRKKIPGIAATL
jgi:hypothetical protein